jgi:hypothetical protein
MAALRPNGAAVFFFFSLLPATLAVVLGYFVLFASTRAQGAVRIFGLILATWIFVIAAALPVAGAYATYAGFSPGQAMRSMHSGGSP